MSMSFPSIFVPEDEKDEKYHKTFIQSITSQSVMSGYSERNVLMNECVNFYLGLQGGEEFEFMQKAEDGEVLPAKWMDFNKIAVKMPAPIIRVLPTNSNNPPMISLTPIIIG